MASPMFRLNQLHAGTHFGDSSVRFRCGPPGCLPSVLTRPKWLGVHLAAWGFYVRASSPRVTPRTAGYDYGATWGPAPAGLAPASQAVSFAALPPRGPSGRFPRVVGVGSEEARRSAGLRPPLKLDVRFSRIQLSQWRVNNAGSEKESGRSGARVPTRRTADAPEAVSSPDNAIS